MTHAATERSQGAGGRALLTFEDLTHDLVWPRLLRAGVLAFHPVRLFVAFLLVALIAGFLWFLLWLESTAGWAGSPESREHLARLLQPPPPSAPRGPNIAAGRIVDMFFAVPIQMVRVHPLAMIVGAPVSIILAALGMGAISRMAATEFATGRSDPVLQALGFARQRLASLVGAVLGPLFVVWGIALILAVGGFILARWPGVNLVGSVFYGLALLLGLFAMFLLIVYVFGKPLLIPGICCDGADALDAIQRAYSYVLTKPLRLVVYLGILAIQGFILLALVTIVCAATVAFTARATGKWAGDDGRRMVYAERSPLSQISDPPATPPLRDRLFNAGSAVVRAWNGIPAALPLAFLFSYSACAATLLYLGMRRVCDGQDMSELWSPQEDRTGALGAGAATEENDADGE